MKTKKYSRWKILLVDKNIIQKEKGKFATKYFSFPNLKVVEN